MAVDNRGGSSGKKVLSLRLKVLNRSWGFCAHTKTERKRDLLWNSPKVPGTGGLRMPDQRKRRWQLPSTHGQLTLSDVPDSSVLSLDNITAVIDFNKDYFSHYISRQRQRLLA